MVQMNPTQDQVGLSRSPMELENIGRVRQSVQRIADELEAEGFLKYVQNPHHRRAPVLVLTEKVRSDS